MNVEKQYRRTNLLQEHDYYYNLQDVEQPVLFRDSFPYDQVPKTRFNHRLVPMYFPDHIWITDTTFVMASRLCSLLRQTRFYISIN